LLRKEVKPVGERRRGREEGGEREGRGRGEGKSLTSFSTKSRRDKKLWRVRKGETRRGRILRRAGRRGRDRISITIRKGAKG
jgi:hypothetical protein